MEPEAREAAPPARQRRRQHHIGAHAEERPATLGEGRKPRQGHRHTRDRIETPQLLAVTPQRCAGHAAYVEKLRAAFVEENFIRLALQQLVDSVLAGSGGGAALGLDEIAALLRDAAPK